MDKIIDYVNNNKQLIIAIIIALAVVTVASILGIIIKKYNLLRFLDKFVAKFRSTDKKSKNDKEKVEKTTPELLPSLDSDEEKTPDESDNRKMESETRGDEEQAEIQNDETSVEPETKTLPNEENIDNPTPHADENPFFDDYSDNEEETDDTSNHPKSEFAKMILESVATGISEEYEEEKNIHQPLPYQKPEKEETINDIPKEEEKKEYEGKWRILRYGAAYCAELHDNSDELLLKSDNYSAIPDVRKAIKALQKNIKANNFNVCVTKNGKFFFKLFSSSGRLIYKSPDFETRQDVINTINEAKRIAFNAEVVRG